MGLRIEAHLLPIILVILCASAQQVPDRRCVPTFFTHPKYFDICKKRVCFTLLVEEPYVFPDPKLLEPQKPFPCLDRQLRGLFFDVLRGVSQREKRAKQAMCIFAGPRCTFDNSVKFIADVVKSDNRYQFIGGGALLFMYHRRTKYTVQSQPWDIDRMVVLYRPKFVRRSFALAFNQIFQPFNGQGWILLGCFLVLFLFGYIIHAFRFSRAESMRRLVRWFFLENHSHSGVWETASWNALAMALVVFSTVLILLYEVSVVNFILQGPDVLVSSIEQFNSFNLTKFGILRGGASETIFKYAVGWNEKEGPFPWFRGKSLEQMVGKMMKKELDYIFTFESTVSNILFRLNLCDKIVAAPTEKRDVSGWYYSSGIPVDLTTSFDKALSQLELKQYPDKWMREYGIRSLSCDKVSGVVDIRVLFVLLGLTVGPFVLAYIIFMVLSCVWKSIDKTDEDEGEEREQLPTPAVILDLDKPTRFSTATSINTGAASLPIFKVLSIR